MDRSVACDGRFETKPTMIETFFSRDAVFEQSWKGLRPPTSPSG